jgi:hypothetical protein
MAPLPRRVCLAQARVDGPGRGAAVDIIVDYYHGNQVGLAALAGELGATYWIPIIYVPVLMITHVVAFYLLVRPRPEAARELP